jgi:O-antigen/teichoic acid export membrane protein
VGQTDAPVATRIGSRTVVNAVYVLGARTVSRLVSLVLVIVLANHLGPADYGRYTTLVAYSALVSVLADLGLSTLYTREAAREPDRLPDFLATLLSGKLLLGAGASLALAAALVFAGLGSLIVPGAALLVLTTYSNLVRNSFYALGRLEFEAFAILLETVLLAALILLGAGRGAGVGWFVWSYAATYATTAVYALAAIAAFRLAPIRGRFDLALLRRWLRLAFPFAIGFFLTNLYFRADVPILQRLRPIQEVGWYQFAYKPFESLQFVPLAVQSVVYPVLGVYHRSDPIRLQQGYERFFKILVLLGWPLTVGTFVLAHPVGRLFRLFAESEPALRILSLAIVFLFANSAFTAMLYAIDRQDLFARATGIAVVVNIGTNLVLIPFFGYLAASGTTVLTEAAFSAAGWWFVGRRHRLPWLRLTWRLLLAGLAMGVVLVPLARFSILFSVPAGLAVYLVALAVLRAVDREEVRLLTAAFGLRRA